MHVCYSFSTGRVFVHEWAHFRWGVFDEYSNDTPFYVSRNSEEASVEATRYYFFIFLLLHYTGLNMSITFSIFSFSVLSLYFVECPWPVHMIKRCLVSNLCCLLCSPENHSCLVLFCKRFRRSGWIILCSVCNYRLQPPFVSYLFI